MYDVKYNFLLFIYFYWLMKAYLIPTNVIFLDIYLIESLKVIICVFSCLNSRILYFYFLAKHKFPFRGYYDIAYVHTILVCVFIAS